jgi:hypothetical protein
MPLLLKAVTKRATLFEVDNTCESSKDVTRRGVIVEIMSFSTASKVKHTSNFSRKNNYSKRSSSWFVSSKDQWSMLVAK